jgi:hypothetical protein
MRIADRGLRNRNAEDSYETEEENPQSVPTSGVQFRCPRSTFRDPQSAFHRLGCTFAATFSRSPFKEMNPVASDWL